MVEFTTDGIFNLHGAAPHCPDTHERLGKYGVRSESSEELHDRLVHDPDTRRLLVTGREFASNFHEKAYYRELLQACEQLGARQYRNIDNDTIITRYTELAASYAFGLIDELTQRVTTGESIFLGVRPAGHHAHHKFPAGFCVFSNAAFAAYRLLCRGHRVFIFDFDAHHGNGTQDFVDHRFYLDVAGSGKSGVRPDDYHFVSVNQEGLWPGVDDDEGENYLVRNLPPEIGDAEFMEFLEDELEPVVARFKPTAVVLSAGFDMCKNDANDPEIRRDIGVDMHLAADSYRAIRDLFEPFPCLYLLEGGYSPRSVELGIDAICE